MTIETTDARAASGLTLSALQTAHVAREAEWCPDHLPDLSFRGNELAGEAGEAAEALILHAAELGRLTGRASNIVKKLERERHGWRGSRATLADLAGELADVIHCAILCAITAGIDIAPAVVANFNSTSDAQDLATRLPDTGLPCEAHDVERAALGALAGMLDLFGGYQCPEFDAAITAMQAQGIDRWSMQAQMEAARVGLSGLSETAACSYVQNAAGGTIYIASKTAHAPRWKQLRAEGLPIISTWIDEAGKGETACFADLWRRCVEEASRASVVIVYREAGEILKGALVEVGAALAAKRPVLAVGCYDLSFVKHPLVTPCLSLDVALAYASGYLHPATAPDDDLAGVADPAPSPTLSQAAQDVLAERRRQVEVEGWTSGHDDNHHLGEMAWAAAAYAEYSARRHPGHRPPEIWPWRRDEWRPGDRRRSLVKSGALILAEIERLDRAAPPAEPAEG